MGRQEIELGTFHFRVRMKNPKYVHCIVISRPAPRNYPVSKIPEVSISDCSVS